MFLVTFKGSFRDFTSFLRETLKIGAKNVAFFNALLKLF